MYGFTLPPELLRPCAPVAQLDRAPDYESGGQEFVSAAHASGLMADRQDDRQSRREPSAVRHLRLRGSHGPQKSVFLFRGSFVRTNPSNRRFDPQRSFLNDSLATSE